MKIPVKVSLERRKRFAFDLGKGFLLGLTYSYYSDGALDLEATLGKTVYVITIAWGKVYLTPDM